MQPRLQRLLAFIDRHPFGTLAGSGLLSLLIYAFLVVRPAWIYTTLTGRLVTLIDISHGQSGALLGMLLVWAALLGLWLAAYRAAKALNGSRRAWLLVIGAGLAFGIVLLFMYPYGSTDIFDYILRSRIWTRYGANPYLMVSDQFTGDPFYTLGSWTNTPTPYGPLWELLAAPASRLAGDNIFTALFLFKGLAALFFAGMTGLLAAILRRRAPARLLPGVLLLVWSPMLLLETFGNGHNDTLMLFSILLAVLLLDRRRYSLGLLALVVGGLVKFLPWFLLPAAGLIALRELPDAKTRLRFTLRLGLISAALIGLAYLPFWSGADTLAFLKQSTRFNITLPGFAYQLLSQAVPPAQAALLVGRAAMLGAFLFALWLGGRAWRDRRWTSFSCQAALFFTAWFALFSTWAMPWYANWAIPFAILLPWGLLPQVAWAFSLSIFTRDWLVEWLFLHSGPYDLANHDLYTFTGIVLPAVWVWMVHVWMTRPVEGE